LTFTIPQPVEDIGDHVRAAGGRAYVVGGSVRDHLMGRAVKDWDVEVYGVDEERLEKLLGALGSVNTVGKAFGVFKCRPRGAADEVDVSIPRRDSKTGPGHRGIAVEGDPDLTLEEACRRRDLTVNAILFNLESRTFIDPFDGRADLSNALLRAVDTSTFLEDPLRALRVVQFCARLGFKVDPELHELCRTAPLEELPVERVRGEWDKLLLSADQPSLGIQLARSTALLERLFPEACVFDDAGEDAVLDRLATTSRNLLEDEGRRLTLMLTGWLAGCSQDAVAHTLDRLGVFRVGGYSVRDQVTALHAHWRDAIDTAASLRRMATHCEVHLVLGLRTAHGEQMDAVEARAAALGVLHAPMPPLLMGRHLQEMGVKPGPKMGDVLRAVYDQQVEGVITTLEDARSAARKLYEDT
jgi:tRNA nucleotidyltransferase (CCA-adding enzyme)